ncbi:MAG TPA: hypothetical protein VLS96_21810, partial [Nodosilinea sp.]|nr:hypothetical protein [Nodosilinea sp.]
DDIRRMALETAFTTFTTCTTSLTSIFKNLGNSRQKNKERKEKEKEIESNYAFNYGAATSLRERVSHTNKYHRYFQSLDKEMYLKSIEGRIVDGLSKFLDSKNIDTSDLKETKSTILNHGVMVSGGSIQAQNLTVGEQAKSIFNTLGNSGGSSEGGSTPSV